MSIVFVSNISLYIYIYMGKVFIELLNLIVLVVTFHYLLSYIKKMSLEGDKLV